MKKSVKDIATRIGSALLISASFVVDAYAGEIAKGNWSDFGIENADTVIHLNCHELAINAITPLFYADFRDNFTVEADIRLNTRVTEQAFICKEGGKGEVVGDLTIGFDPEEEKIFAEVKDTAGTPRRIKAGDKIVMGKWYFFYHDGSYMIDGQPGGDCRRRVCVEELSFAPDGSINPITLTEAGLSNNRKITVQ